MRRQYTKVLKTFFHGQLFQRRVDLGFTQEEMAYRLVMSNRTYIELDHGNSCCSALTLALFLIYVCADPIDFLNELQNAFENTEIQVA